MTTLFLEVRHLHLRNFCYIIKDFDNWSGYKQINKFTIAKWFLDKSALQLVSGTPIRQPTLPYIHNPTKTITCRTFSQVISCNTVKCMSPYFSFGSDQKLIIQPPCGIKIVVKVVLSKIVFPFLSRVNIYF